jgi:hypothetical protein
VIVILPSVSLILEKKITSADFLEMYPMQVKRERIKIDPSHNFTPGNE